MSEGYRRNVLGKLNHKLDDLERKCHIDLSLLNRYDAQNNNNHNFVVVEGGVTQDDVTRLLGVALAAKDEIFWGMYTRHHDSWGQGKKGDINYGERYASVAAQMIHLAVMTGRSLEDKDLEDFKKYCVSIQMPNTPCLDDQFFLRDEFTSK